MSGRGQNGRGDFQQPMKSLQSLQTIQDPPKMDFFPSRAGEHRASRKHGLFWPSLFSDLDEISSRS